jgi:hypothetical protein
MLIRFLKSENSERLDSWSGGTEANLHVPRVGDIIKIVRRVAGAVKMKPYDAFFRVERVIWDGSNIVDVILRETVE